MALMGYWGTGVEPRRNALHIALYCMEDDDDDDDDTCRETLT